MFTRTRQGFTLADLLVAITLVCVVLAILAPALGQMNENGRRDLCANKLKQFATGVLMSAYARKRLPSSTSTNVAFASAGSANPAATTTPDDTTMSGFSWIVRILPYLGEAQAYDTIVIRSNRFNHTVAPFADTMTVTGSPFSAATQFTNRHLATLDFDFLHCPSFSGKPYSVPLGGAGQPASYQSAKFAPASGLALNPPIGLTNTNYVALSATHMNCMAQSPTALPLSQPPNGVLIPGRRINFSGIPDGQSKTFMLCETREQGYNSWYDGSTAWTVGILASTGDYHSPGTGLETPEQALDANFDPPRPQWRASKNPASLGKTALNFGSLASQAGPKNIFIASAGTGDDHVAAATGASEKNPWGFGPSSEHPGVVQHVLVDGAVRAVSDKIDPTLYMRLITRAGQEPDAMVPE